MLLVKTSHWNDLVSFLQIALLSQWHHVLPVETNHTVFLCVKIKRVDWHGMVNMPVCTMVSPIHVFIKIPFKPLHEQGNLCPKVLGTTPGFLYFHCDQTLHVPFPCTMRKDMHHHHFCIYLFGFP